MKKETLHRHYLPFTLFLACLSMVIGSYVAGPPTGSTNAPGEKTCYSSPACHGGTPDTGPGFGELTIDGGVPPDNYYIPGSTYTMMPYAVDTAKMKGGFQVVARLANGTNAGASTIIMPDNTQLITSGGYQYVEQTATGAVKPVMANMHDWMYEWQAPPSGSGMVTFYVAFIAANGDGSASGDNIYTDTLVLYEDTTSGIRDLYGVRDFTIKRMYPLPAKDFVNIVFSAERHLEISVSVTDLKGSIAVPEIRVLIGPASNSHTLNLQELSAGIYFVNVKQSDKPALLQKMVKF